MSLNITLFSKKVIYQSADFRLTDLRTGRPWDRITQKSIVVTRMHWSALIGFVGIGHTGTLDIANWLASRTNEVPFDAPFDILVDALLEANVWLHTLPRRQRFHTFTVGAYIGVVPRAVLISTFESLESPPRSTPHESFQVSQRSFFKPRVVVTGQPSAVPEGSRQLLLRAIRGDRPPLEFHELLANVNARAASRNTTISPGCFTSHLAITGEGEAIAHGVDERSNYLPLFAQNQMHGLRLNPDVDEAGRPKPMQFRGMTYARFEQTDEFQQLQLRERPNDPNTHNNFGVYLSDVKHDYAKAMHSFRRALEIDPKHPLALVNYAVHLWRHDENHQEAEQFFLRALAVDSDRSLAYTRYAEFLIEAEHDLEKAEAIYAQGYEHNPNNSTLLLSYFAFRVMRREYEEAALLNTEYIRVAGRDSKALANEAIIAFLTGGNHDICIALYREALEKQPNYSLAQANLAQVLFCVGRQRPEADIEADRLIEQCLAVESDRTILLEVWFYRLLHIPSHRDEAIRQLFDLIQSGARSRSWDFSCNLVRMRQEDHADADMLESLAAVITGHSEPSQLAKFDSWPRQ